MNSEHASQQKTAAPPPDPQVLDTRDSSPKASGDVTEEVDLAGPAPLGPELSQSAHASSASTTLGEGVHPSPRGIQEHQVWAAADELLIEGERPTIERVRKKLGGGSPNTVSPMLNRWFAILGSRLASNPVSPSSNAADISTAAAPSSALGIDLNLPPILHTTASKLWMDAQAEARKALARQEAHIQAEEQRHRANFEARSTKLRQEQASFAQARAGLESELASAHQALNAIRGQIEGAVRAQHESQRDVLRLKYQLAQAHAEQEGQRRSLDKEEAQRMEDAREMKLETAEREKRLLSELEEERSATQRALADLLKEQEARLRAEQELARAGLR